ncbi:EAL domain-containing response regulator [Arenimonas terrae]|uniref:EAL domain-containing response regulator n=1 Tax=Arenimonas terrae TaxID=2546226 RepID=A0A5C4RQ78_9GAMM|nr:EAL domain-containing response regulator [Arenimonas terrae]TNJ32891.1 EAL domain-containing response regulator [Arenimonas terrae]
MNPHDESRLAEHRHAFLRLLPRRVETIGRRLHRFLQEGWDINGLALMHDDARFLGEACGRHGLDGASGHFRQMQELLGETLQQQALPDPALGERLWHLVEDIGEAVPVSSEPAIESTAARRIEHAGRAETPPPNYWRRWGDDAPTALAPPAAPEPVAMPATAAPPPAAAPVAAETPARSAAPAPPPRSPTAATPTAPTAAPPRPAPASAPAPPPRQAPVMNESSPSPVAAGIRVYHLTDHGPLSLELDQRMEALGYEVELLADAEELQELLGALPAHLAVVDAAFSDQLEAIGQTVRAASERGPQKVKLVALAEADDIALRLSARRAGVDALVVEPNGANDVLKRLHQLLNPGSDAPYRVLIVEDDRSQALFAEGILRNAGMDTMVVLEPLDVLQALHQFNPDLILMDLHMPHANGMELTVLIRDQEPFLHTPIVFLSGESDPDAQFDVLEAGGDDFISKPVRPKHLIAAVQNRVSRHRALENRRTRHTGRHPDTGLHDREQLLESLDALLDGAGENSPGGALFLEIESVNLLRDRLGLTALEQLLIHVGKLLGERADPTPVARFGDGSYLILDPSRDEAGLEALATQLRNALVQHPFSVQGHPLRLRVSVGICALRHRFPDQAALLNAVERMAREARTQEKGLKRFEPVKPTEAVREAALVKQIREAIALNSLELLYQPVVAVAGSDDSQYQVLLRLRGADGKLLPAAEVIPLAERGDFILDIDRWVLQASMKLIRDRRAEGRPLRLFVTQSALTLADPSQATWLKSELVAHDVPGTSVVIELRLEDAAIHAATVRYFCDTMVDDGVQFCLSQFESGADAERLLDELPLGFVKLARKYTSTALSGTLRDELKVLIDRSHRRGLEVIGHGVEDAQAAATLWMSGIDFIQGNLVQQAERDMDFDFQQAVL